MYVRKKVEIMPARIDLLQRIKDFLHRMHLSTPIVKDIFAALRIKFANTITELLSLTSENGGFFFDDLI